MTGVLIGRGEEIETLEENAGESRGRSSLVAAASQGVLRIANRHQELGRGQEGFLPESQREHGRVDALMSDF